MAKLTKDHIRAKLKEALAVALEEKSSEISDNILGCASEKEQLKPKKK